MIEKNKFKNKKLVIFGETHGFLNDAKIQKEIITLFQPTIFLYEMLEETELLATDDKIKFLNQPNDKEFSIISIVGELKPTIKLANKHDLPIAGMDIKNMCRKNKYFLTKTKLTEEEQKNEEEILEKREKMQVKKILEHLNAGKKVFASTGAFHLRKNSPLLKINNSLIIYPAYEGKQLFDPPENFDIKKVTFKLKEIASHV